MIEIYGTTTCVYCKNAVKMAEDRNLKYVYHNMDVDIEYYDELKARKPDFKTVPQIWWDGRYIGGSTDLAAEIENTLIGYGDGKVSRY